LQNPGRQLADSGLHWGQYRPGVERENPQYNNLEEFCTFKRGEELLRIDHQIDPMADPDEPTKAMNY
jgi:hypothetical protein